MDTCKHCRWWRVALGEAQPLDYGQCMHDPPVVSCHYDSESDRASLFYERPQTHENDYCSRFAGKGK